MLDRMHPAARHLLLAALPVLAGWALTDLVPLLQGRWPQAALAWALLQQGLLYATPLTRQYGAGSNSDTL